MTFVATLSIGEHKRKLEEDSRLDALVGRVSEEIPKFVVQESLKTLSIKEMQRKAVEEATMMDTNGESVLEKVVLESVIAHLEDEVRRIEIWEIEKVQSTTKDEAVLMPVSVAERQVEIEATMVPEDMDHEKNDSFEEDMFKFVIKASLWDLEDDIVETNLGENRLYLKPMSIDDDQLVKVAQSEEMDTDSDKWKNYIVL